MSDEYMTFEEAAQFLSTSSSTLYRWLREDKIPAHKLGRQWRFLRAELESWRAGSADTGASDGFTALGEMLTERAKSRGGEQMEERAAAWDDASLFGEQILWDAYDSGASVVHIQPVEDRHRLSYRTEEGLEHLIDIPSAAFDALDRQWVTASAATHEESSRRMFIERESGDRRDALQVRYQRLETLAGSRQTLRLLRRDPSYTSLSRVAKDEDERVLRRWLKVSHGLILLSGKSGSGKTSTAYACLAELAEGDDRVIFTIEETAGSFLPGVNQVEIDLDDARAYRSTFRAVFDSDPDVLFIASTFAQPHQELLWGTALNAAESGHLVIVQMEAESASDAIERFGAATDREFENILVGSCWQELIPKASGRGREAVYDMVSGDLGI